MNNPLTRLLRWYPVPTLGVTLCTGPIARGLAQLRSVGCVVRNAGKCPYERVLFACADCTLQPTQPPGD
jgi:hypothetical protein